MHGRYNRIPDKFYNRKAPTWQTDHNNRTDWPIMNDNYTINYDLSQFLVLCIDCTPVADQDGANGHGGK